MELKSYVSIEVVSNERTYNFVMPVGAPFGEAYDACYQALAKILELAKNASEQAKPVGDNNVS